MHHSCEPQSCITSEVAAQGCLVRTTAYAMAGTSSALLGARHGRTTSRAMRSSPTGKQRRPRSSLHQQQKTCQVQTKSFPTCFHQCCCSRYFGESFVVLYVVSRWEYSKVKFSEMSHIFPVMRLGLMLCNQTQIELCIF